MTILTTPLTLPCGAVLPNRLAKSALSEALAGPDGLPNQALQTLYRRWGKGGLGLIVTGNVMVDAAARGEPGNVVVESEAALPGLRAWAEAAGSAGSPCWAQINHPGKQAPKGLNRAAVAPSALPLRKDLAPYFHVPRALGTEEIAALVARYARVAALCKDAGFQGVQIHGAHGYLVSQFLSPLHNQRTDEYGGSIQNRMRFAVEVYRAMRKAVGAAFPVGIKLNSADFQRGGFTEEESLAVVRTLAEEGMDLIEISGGTYESPRMTGAGIDRTERTAAREAYFLAFAERVRSVTRTPLMVTGGFRTYEGMRQAVASGATDMVGLGRPLCVEPEIAKRILAGLDPVHTLAPVTTGISAVDKLGMVELVYYGRQLRRMGHGKEPQPSASALGSLVVEGFANGARFWQQRKLRA
jgi:2,4-dienoyl-CoA reductase-like NADH-dependent reductase (Old Yellow Enzyme family)